MTVPVLMIDDEQSTCELVRDALSPQGYDVRWCVSGAHGLELLREQDFEAVITDLNLPEMSGLDLCNQVTDNQPDLPVIMITANGDMQAAISAVRAGAYDFINEPLEMEALAHALERAVQHRRLRREVLRLMEKVSARREGLLVGESPPMRRVYDLITRVGKADASVVISGESGTGKELVARELHAESERADKPFVAINCSAVSANLLESALFGHAKGAFTDAKATRRGLFEEADGGTIFLDEVSDMPEEMQAKLLRVLQERTVRPVGGNGEVPIDTRVVTATNRDLETEVEQGRFREDLYYRLNVVQIHVPPLRARGNDILLLAQYFLDKVTAVTSKGVKGISSEAARKLLEYDWPGNVRQLENSIERAVTLARFDQLTVSDFPDRIARYERTHVTEVDAEPMLSLNELERRYIEKVLEATAGNKTRAAKILGLDRRTLYRKLERYEAKARRIPAPRGELAEHPLL